MIRFNIRLSFRNILKRKVYSFLIIGGFAIGFAACILIGLFYHSESSVNKCFANYKQVYRLYDIKKNRYNMDWDLFPIIMQNYAEIEGACPLEYDTGNRLVAKNEKGQMNAEIQHLLSTTNNFFSIFSVDVVESLAAKPFDGKESIVLSKSLAKKLFGTQNPLGQEVNLNNRFSGTVTAIINDLPANSSFHADMILNSENENFRLSKTCSNNFCYNPANLFVMLKPGTNPGSFANKLNGALASYSMDVDSVGMQNLADIYLTPLTAKSRHAKGNPMLLKIFLGIAVLILLLSSINYLNYSISMQYAKMKEIGINKTNGASFRNLVNYSFIEVSFGVLISLILSIFITLLALPYSEKLFGKNIFVGLDDLFAIAPVFVGVILLVIIVNSLAPIYILSRFKITEFLSGFSGKRNQKQIGKQSMLTFQLTVSVALIAIVIIIFKQLNYVKHSDLGFDKESLVKIDIPYKFGNIEPFKQETEKLPFVKACALSSGCPGMINYKYGTNSGENSFNVSCIKVDDNFLKTMGIELVKGRNFLNGDIDKACLINEEAIKQYQWESIDGQRFNNGREGGYEVIGVIKDFKFTSFYQEVGPLALLYTSSVKDRNVLSVKLAPGNIGQQIDQIKQIWKKISSNEPFNFTFYDDQFQAMYAKEEKLASSITFFSIVAIVLTCMGILGQIFMISLNRRKEIGIRKVNGARIWEVLVMLNRDFVKWIAFAFVLATPVAWYSMHKWLESFAYKTALSWWVFALSGLLTLGIAIITVSWQSWKAATRNPVEALRHE